VIALPAFYGMMHQRGLSVQSILRREIINVFQVKNFQFTGGAETIPIGLSYKYKDVHFTFDYKLKAFTDYQISAPLLSVALLGNASIIGGSVNASPYGLFSSYTETAIGARYQTNGFSIGGRVKLLNGIQNIHTARSDLDFSVNDDIYQLQLQGDLLINSSFPIDFSNLNEISVRRIRLFPNNLGMGVDLGVSYQSGPFKVSGSVIDLGFINWKQNVRNYQLSGNFTYDGADFNEVVNGDFNFIDTLGGFFDVSETNNAFNSFVPAKVYGSISYDLNENWSIGGLGYYQRRNDLSLGALAVTGTRNWNQRHGVSVQYSIMGVNLTNIGFSGFTTLGPFQFYAVMDNILGFVQPLGAQNVNGRVGLNLVFGKMEQSWYAKL
jgi:hypothetical protein